MTITTLILGVAFLIAGVLFASGKLLDHIDAWKKTPDEEKANVKIIPLCRNIGAMISLCGVLFILHGAIPSYPQKVFTISVVVWIVLCCVDIVFIQKSNHYKNN